MALLVSLRLRSDCVFPKSLFSALLPRFISQMNPWVGLIWPSFLWPCRTGAAPVAGMAEADASALASRVCGQGTIPRHEKDWGCTCESPWTAA